MSHNFIEGINIVIDEHAFYWLDNDKQCTVFG
jgi:hypothetical protein